MNQLTKAIVLLLTILSLTYISYGQQIIGKIQDANKEAIPYANIAVYNADKTSLITGGVSNDAGIFNVAVKPGTYTVIINFLSFKDESFENVVVEAGQPNSLGNITLVEKELNLDEVVVQAERSTMEFKLDKRVFNVGKDLANTGGNTLEVLDNVPSVTVDVEGNVELRGSGNVRILIDGKPSSLSGNGSTDALRTLPANILQSIEVITNPSAKYDADGEAGIINLVLKKEMKKGLNGSVDLTTGYPANHGVGVNLNMRKDKVNWFTNAGINYNRFTGGGENFTRLTTGNETVIYETLRDQIRGGYGGNLQLGADYLLNPLNTITISGLAKYTYGQNEADIEYTDFNEQMVVTNNSYRFDDETEPRTEWEAAINYTKKFKQKNKKWSTDLKYIVRDDTEENEFEENGSILPKPIFQRGNNIEDSKEWVLQTDFETPLLGNAKIETGAKASLRNIENTYKVEQLDAGEWFVFENFDNQLLYGEDIYAAYATYSNEYGNFGYQFGMRAEYSDISIEQQNDVNGAVDKEYLDIFPSAFFSYKVSEKNQVQLSYSRRISRPRFWNLLPFFTFSDNRNRFSGNPNLDPEYTNSFELGYLTYLDKGSILSSVYTKNKINTIERFRQPLGNDLTQSFPINAGDEQSFGIEFNANYDIAKWWSANANANFYTFKLNGEYEGELIENDGEAFNTRFSTKFKLPHQINLQTSFNYRAPATKFLGKNLASYNWDMGISKELFKRKGTLTFSGKDILNTRKRRSITETDRIYQTSEFQWRGRAFVLGFNYRINQDKPSFGRGGRPGGGQGR